jgi:hypothetical protein
MITLARNFDVFAPRISAGFTAIFVARGHFATTRDMGAFGFVLILHLRTLSFSDLCLLSITDLARTGYSMQLDLQTFRLNNFNAIFAGPRDDALQDVQWTTLCRLVDGRHSVRLTTNGREMRRLDIRPSIATRMRHKTTILKIARP